MFGEISTKTIKTYTIARSFGVETRELTQSTFVRYDSKGRIKDSTLYIHNIPLSEKYSYINYNDRRSLKKLEGIERLMHFKYEYNIKDQLVSKNLFGNNNDSLRWREFYKYLSNGKLWKIIRFDPSKVHPDNKINGLDPNIITTEIKLLKKIGAKIKTYDKTILIKGPKKIKSLKFLETKEYNGFPTDLQAQFMALLCKANGRSVIQERIFENRFTHIGELKRLGAKISIIKNKALIKGLSLIHI